jgi:hypothetical protein
MKGLGVSFAAIVVLVGATGCQLSKKLSGDDTSAAATASAGAAAAGATAATGAAGAATAATATAAAAANEPAGASPTPKAAGAAVTATATTPKPAAAPAAADPGKPGAACANIAGTWITGGTCGPDRCAITQNGCSTNFKCSNGNASYAGSLSGKSVTYAGVAANGKPGSCTGTVSADARTIRGTCKGALPVPCTFVATKR